MMAHPAAPLLRRVRDEEEEEDDDDLRPPLARRPRRDGPPPNEHPLEAGPHVLRDATFTQADRIIKMWRDGQLCDVAVSVEGRRFTAHRLVLASGSDMLAAAFAPEWQSTEQPLLELHDVPAAGFERCLEFLYTGACPVSEATLTPTLDAASRLQVWPLVRLGEQFLQERLDCSNCVDAMRLAEGLQLTRLAEAARQLLLSEFERACAADGFLELDQHRLRALLSSEMLVAPEEAVFDALIRWARHRGAPSAL